MTKGTESAKHFVNNLLKYEVFKQFLVYNTLLILASLFCGNAADNVLNYIFSRMEKALGINSNANWWILVQVVIQLMVISTIAFITRLLVVGLLHTYVGHTHTLNDISGLSMIYATFISVLPQDHLISRLKKLNVLLDR